MTTTFTPGQKVRHTDPSFRDARATVVRTSDDGLVWIDWGTGPLNGYPAAALLDANAPVTEAEKRYAFVRGLRDLAAFIEAHPDLPLPYRAHMSYFPGGTDEEERAEVDRIAGVLGQEPVTRAGGDHYLVERWFGRVGYQATAITADHMARYDAHMSYDGAVEPAGVSR
jgi:hypothetical protein